MTLKIDQISDKGRKQIRLNSEFRSDHIDQVKARSTNGGWQGIRFLRASAAATRYFNSL
jgi:hypothetical protein